MNRLLFYISFCLLTITSGAVLLSCGNWEIPALKSQRDCGKPGGTLMAQIQQLKVDFSISGSSGTIDKVSWDFGNGSTTVTTGMTVSYVYSTSGTYTAKATLTNSCTDTDETILQQVISVSNALLPTVSLQPATEITNNSSTFRVTVTSTGNAPITRYGVCYSSTNGIPDITNDRVADRTDPIPINTSVPFSLTGLQPNTLYYVRGFAVNSAGPGYSSPIQTFQTGFDPSVAVDSVSNGISTVTMSIRVTSLGSPAISSYGVCYASNVTVPDLSNSPNVSVSNPTVGSNLLALKNLTPNTKYYYRLYTTSASGVQTYGNVGFFTTYADPVSQDLIASVSFTDQSLLDISGYDNHVKLVGNPTFTTDRKSKGNSAILLDGVNDYFYMPYSSSLEPDALSISIWIKPATVAGRMQIYNKSRFSDGAFEMYSSLIKPNDGGTGVTINTDIKQGGNCQGGMGWQTFTFTSVPDLTQWHHIVMTYSGRSARMYFDKVLLYQRDDLPTSSIDKCSGGELKFGAQAQALPQYFKGALDDIRIYKRMLSASEVEALYNQ